MAQPAWEFALELAYGLLYLTAYAIYKAVEGVGGAAYIAAAVLDVAAPAFVLYVSSEPLSKAERTRHGIRREDVKETIKNILMMYFFVLFVSWAAAYGVAVVTNDGNALIFPFVFTVSMIPVGLTYLAVRVVAARVRPLTEGAGLSNALAGLAMYVAVALLVVVATRSLVVAAVAAGAVAATMIYARVDRLREAMWWDSLARRVGEVSAGLTDLLIAYKRARQKLVLEEGRLSDRALQLYYLLDQARLVARFLVDREGRLDGDRLEAAMADPPREAVAWVDEGVLESLGVILSLTDPQGLRIYRAQDGRFHVAAGDVIDVPVASPQAAASALYDVIARLRAEIEKETGRPYRPLVAVRFLPALSWDKYYNLDSKGLLEEIREHPDDYRELLGEETLRRLLGQAWPGAEGEAQEAQAPGPQEGEQRPSKRRKKGGAPPPPPPPSAEN